MGNITDSEKELITKKINSGNTKYDEKIKKEYEFIKTTIKNPSLNLPQYNALYNSDTTNNSRVIISPINIIKREERLGKWFKMIFSNEIFHQ